MDLETKIEKTYDLLKKRSIDDFEIYGTDSDTIRAESKEGSMGSLSKSRESGVGVRLIIDGAMGFAYGAEPTDELVDAAITSADISSRIRTTICLPARRDTKRSISWTLQSACLQQRTVSQGLSPWNAPLVKQTAGSIRSARHRFHAPYPG